MVGCPTCGAELTYLPPYRRHYCYGCRSYAPQAIHACKVCGRALVFVQRHHRHYCYGCQEYTDDVDIENPCPTCGEELTYVAEYGRFFCHHCKEYAPKAYAIAKKDHRGRSMTKSRKKKEEAIGHAPFSRKEMDLASKEQLMKWCREYGLDDSGLKYELRLRLLEHIRRQGLLLKGEESPEEVPEVEVESGTAMEDSKEAVVVTEVEEALEQPEEAAISEEAALVEAPGVIQGGEMACPTCGRALTYIPQYDRWYCYQCQAYAEGTVPPYRTQPPEVESHRAARRAAKVRRTQGGNPMVGVSLAIMGLLMYIADEILFNAPRIFDIPVLITAPEVDFALRFLSTIFIAMGIIAAVLLVRQRR